MTFDVLQHVYGDYCIEAERRGITDESVVAYITLLNEQVRR